MTSPAAASHLTIYRLAQGAVVERFVVVAGVNRRQRFSNAVGSSDMPGQGDGAVGVACLGTPFHGAKGRLTG